MKDHIVLISAGSNIGDKSENCRKGISALIRTKGALLLKESKFYKTGPVDYTDQDWFVNCAVKISTPLEPVELLTEIKRIESEAGRKKDAVRFGPRVLDLDIIFFDDQIIDQKIESDNLIIPHPRMHQRRFVLMPICDIDPSIIHPVFKKSIRILLAELDNSGQKVSEL
ncbi:MAG: 2-amino-4-hydroxy-6-hydroxymethyldihydropteridine diphosphokinase [Deltaproteobacteria bacterium]|nr:2-amino-4-hydroxy-6-hydroxymethyldihydropteridine diphosphokinase [Deltaproteobacteria bacterium]